MLSRSGKHVYTLHHFFPPPPIWCYPYRSASLQLCLQMDTLPLAGLQQTNATCSNISFRKALMELIGETYNQLSRATWQTETFIMCWILKSRQADLSTG